MMSTITPELYVTDLDASLAFYCALLGFKVDYDRPEDRFACIRIGSSTLMLEEPIGRTWLAGPFEPPFGRGVNFQVMVRGIEVLFERCCAAGAPVFHNLETKDYRRRDGMVSQTQFVVQDPDGYLIRLAEEAQPVA